jgi:reductive dehalogenase
MTDILIFITALSLVVHILICLAFFISCIREKESRAAAFGGLQLAVPLGLFGFLIYLKGSGFFDSKYGMATLGVGMIFIVLTPLLLVIKISRNNKALAGTKGLIIGSVQRFDERVTVFSRNRALRPGSEQYQRFYAQHPEYEEYDTARRKLGGPVGKPGLIDKPHEKPNLAASVASVNFSLHLSVPEIVTPRGFSGFKGERVSLSPAEATERVKGFGRHIGAGLIGISELNPSWIYSHRGEIFHENWEDWGREIDLNHRYVIIFTTEMSFEMIAAAPHTPTSIESRVQYAKGAAIATQLAAFIANLGYAATANHFRHYDLLLVPAAVDAGLGEMGRFGYLITKKFGPRVRLAAVTTDLPLIPDKPVDIGVEDFCRDCKKCAICCPSNSIAMEDQTEVNGSLRWKLNEETCFEYWGKVGTGCNICMRVCPWSHAGTLPHQLIKILVSRNRMARRLFTTMDDIFYGKKPKSKEPPAWARYN